MALLDELAEFLAGVRYADLSRETVDRAKLHIFDSLGALLAGASTAEAKTNADLVQDVLLSAQPSGEGAGIPVPGFGFSAPLPLALLLSCLSTRMTETDDIDIASCTTIGSVIVPAVLLLGSARKATGGRLIEGAVTGYEVFTRLGEAVDGAEIIYRGLWPTYLCGAVAVAAAGSRILGLRADDFRNALAISLSLSTGVSGRVKAGLSSRWLILGCAASNGLIACLAAARGFAGDQTLLEGLFTSAHGLDLKREVLMGGLGDGFRIGRVNLKPYCSARQAVASVEALRWLLRTHEIKPETVEELEVIIPRQYSQMLDVPGFPENRLASITSIRYQLALAAFYEDDLYDVERKVLRNEARIRSFMEKVRITPDDSFTSLYPKKWPGRIVLRKGKNRFEHEVLSPKGDVDQPMSWEDVEQKLERLCRPFFDPAKIAKLREYTDGLDGAEKVDDLFHFLHLT